jgi:hypothetical protein
MESIIGFVACSSKKHEFFRHPQAYAINEQNDL